MASPGSLATQFLFMAASLSLLSLSKTARAMTTSTSGQTPPRIAIIGGGAAGLSAARVSSRNGWTPRVFEKDADIGGVWNYKPESSTRPMYKGLRTNLPKEIMGFREMIWSTKDSNIEESYVTHSDVLQYLQKYREEFNLSKYITFGATVKQMTMLVDEDGYSKISLGSERLPQVKIEWEESDGEDLELCCKSEVFDAVMICNGHYAAPSTPFIPGMEEFFEGDIVHSITYDEPQKFSGKTVLCVGGRASGSDVAREISRYANQVYLSDTTCTKPESLGNVMWLPKTIAVEKDSIQFDHAASIPTVDTIIFCSGYDYSFPFINDKSNLDLQAVPGERRVMPLFEQFWHARYPNVAFVGLPHSVVPFPMFELQAEAAHGQWASSENNALELPKMEDRLDQAAIDAVSGGAKNEAGRIQNTHYLGNEQWNYCLRMAQYAGLENDASFLIYAALQWLLWIRQSMTTQGQLGRVIFPEDPTNIATIVTLETTAIQPLFSNVQSTRQRLEVT